METASSQRDLRIAVPTGENAAGPCPWAWCSSRWVAAFTGSGKVSSRLPEG